ncbi:unnamed protein product, partial [Meganyctiphanes norvegica]
MNGQERKTASQMEFVKGEESEDDYGGPSSRLHPPGAKRMCVTQMDLLNHILQEITEIKTCMNTRLTSLETKVSVLVQTCNRISGKIDSLEQILGKQTEQVQSSATTIMVQENSSNSFHDDQESSSGYMNIISLNSEEDFPHGSWLGDPNSPTARVRCPVTPQNLLHINSTSITAEKMALTLLDYLFTKEELATSNLSGRSRWNKRQLDPLMIFGIRCHLVYKFNITSKAWHKICQNMDSKCRSAWKRRVRGMVGQSRNRAPIGHTSSTARKDPAVSEDISFDFDSLQNSNLDLSDVKVITQSPTCELRILNATPEQIAQLQDSQEIILSEEQILAASSVNQAVLASSAYGISATSDLIAIDHLRPGYHLTARPSATRVIENFQIRLTQYLEDLTVIDH